MDPISMMFAGGSGIASILAAIMGADEQSKNREQNLNLDLYNTRHQDAARQQGIDYADKLQREQHLGGSDAEGNRTRFIPGQGWVSEYGSRPQKLLDYFYGQELPARRSKFQRDDAASRSADDMSNQLLDEFKRTSRGDPKQIENMLYEASTRGIGEQTNSALEVALRQALRTGSGSTGDIVGKIQQSGAKARGNAARDAKIQSMDYVDDKYNSSRSNTSALMNAFNSKARADLAPSFDPTGLSNNPLMAMFMQQAGQGNAAMSGAIGRPVSQRSPIPVDDGGSNVIGSIGQVMGGLGERIGGMNAEKENNDLLRQFITGGGQLDLGRGGIFGGMADRVRTGGGGF